MAETTRVQWAHHTFSPIRGCTKVHLGCDHCYAEKYGNRFGIAWGDEGQRVVAADGAWQRVRTWARAAARDGVRRRVFPSLCDPLDERWPSEVFGRYMDLIRETALVTPRGDNALAWGGPLSVPVAQITHAAGVPLGGLDHLLLTKRPERWRCIPEDVRPLVRLGTSASDQPTWDEWVGRLVKAEGFARLFVSLEPMVGPVDASNLLGYCYQCDKPHVTIDSQGRHATSCERPVVSWVIVGGESGPKARPCDVAWIRSVVGQCKAAGVPAFVKQLGANVRDRNDAGFLGNDMGAEFGDAWNINPEQVEDNPNGFLEEYQGAPVRIHLRDSHGGNPDEWPADLRVREFPEVRP